MDLVDFIRSLPSPLRRIVYAVYHKFGDKYYAEMAFWESRYKKDNENFSNESYQGLMLAIAKETDASYFDGKVVVDFGCGPRGSLAWMGNADLRVGVDVLMDRYVDSFFNCMKDHETVYVKSTEKVIPLPSNFADVVMTINSIDHVNNLETMCNELIRVLKPGGTFLGSFNLEEPPAPCEPQKLDEEIVKKHLLNFLEVKSYRVASLPADGNRYKAFDQESLEYTPGEEGTLWIRAEKPSS